MKSTIIVAKILTQIRGRFGDGSGSGGGTNGAGAGAGALCAGFRTTGVSYRLSIL
jgi:hypothetical protein